MSFAHIHPFPPVSPPQSHLYTHSLTFEFSSYPSLSPVQLLFPKYSWKPALKCDQLIRVTWLKIYGFPFSQQVWNDNVSAFSGGIPCSSLTLRTGILSGLSFTGLMHDLQWLWIHRCICHVYPENSFFEVIYRLWLTILLLPSPSTTMVFESWRGSYWM